MPKWDSSQPASLKVLSYDRPTVKKGCRERRGSYKRVAATAVGTSPCPTTQQLPQGKYEFLPTFLYFFNFTLKIP